jgi:hypothetical protein
MIRRLNGWQRLGIVLSVLWIAAVFAYALVELSRGPFSAKLLTEIVPSTTRESIKPSVKGDSDVVLAPVEPRLIAVRIAIAVAVPVVAGWSFVYLLVLVARWIGAGFRKP